MTMEDFSLSALEFDKIVAHLHRFALTDLGHEQIEALAPLDDVNRLAPLLDATVEMADLIRYDDVFPLDTLKDIRQDLSNIKAEGTFLPATRLLQVLSTLQTSRRIQSFVEQRREKYPVLTGMIKDLHVFKNLEASIERTVSEEGEIKDSASPRLRQIRRDLDGKGAQVRKRLESLAKQYVSQGFASEAIVTLRQGRMVIPVKDEHKNVVHGFIHDESASGQTVFIEPAEVLELNNAVRKLQLEETREIERILIELADDLRMNRELLVADVTILAQVELLYIKGRLAQVLNATRPHPNQDGEVHIKMAYHPLLVLKENAKAAAERRPVIPLTIDLGKSGRTLIISGPNAGGKTVALKTVGLLCIMYQSGLLVPCEAGSSLPVFRKILADIGDQQSIENDLSTFSSHVRSLGLMAERVADETLLLIDEIGSGTDPKEGSALAIALLKHFNAKGALSIVTTHHGELKIFAHETEGILNGSMEFDEASLEPTYQFRPGVPGSSYAFEISERMGLPRDLLEEAKKLTGSESLKQEQLILDLHRKIREYENRLADISKKESGFEGLSKMYEERVRTLKTKEKHLRQQIGQEKRDWLAEQKKKLDVLIKELRSAARPEEISKKALSALRTVEGEVAGELAEAGGADRVLEELDHLQIGQRVFIKTMDLEGVITEIFSDQLVEVAVGQL
ncbi:MAG: endonuclease MutS2, partial [Bacteroidetes bacterium]|nr:endonuclease MutS2 [Bacteroidota bacterium]